MSGEQTIDYEALTQDAMRGVVRAVLTRAVKSGLPGDHHFYISFDTQAPGVILSKRLKENEKYKQEMTIVLQHRFWDLAVNDERFEVKLTFEGIPERLVVPFQAIKVFFDPSVRFGLQFEDPDAGADGISTNDDDARPIPGMPHPTTTRSQGPRKPRAARKPRAERDGLSPAETAAARGPGAAAPVAPAPVAPAPVAPATLKPAAATPAAVPASPPAAPAGRPSPPQAPAADAPPAAKDEQKPAAPAAAGAQIVSLDQFRNKK